MSWMALSSIEQARLRLDIFADVELLAESRGGFITRQDALDFTIRGQNLKLIDYGGRGIRNPSDFDATLSIVSSSDGPYADHMGSDGLLRYARRSGSIEGDNRKLRVAMTTGTPIILFERPTAGVLVPITGALVVDEDRDAGFFHVALNEAARDLAEGPPSTPLERKYVTQTVLRRVHQPVFRARVVVAYGTACAVCRLRHASLLDASHIIPDSAADGHAEVNNGLALCKLHHAAYDNNLMGISPDYVVKIRRDLLEEIDGPMLRHGLQEMNNMTISLPTRRVDKPSQEALAIRFDEFRGVA